MPNKLWLYVNIYAEYKSWNVSLLLFLIFSVFNFLFCLSLAMILFFYWSFTYFLCFLIFFLFVLINAAVFNFNVCFNICKRNHSKEPYSVQGLNYEIYADSCIYLNIKWIKVVLLLKNCFLFFNFLWLLPFYFLVIYI